MCFLAIATKKVQDEGHLAFEPFVEAFGAFLNIEEIQDRTAAFEGRRFNRFLARLRMWHRFLLRWGAVERDVKQSLEDFAMHLVERLEKAPGSMLLILDDLQRLDADSKRLLEVFLGDGSPETRTLRCGRMKLICTYRVSGSTASAIRLGEAESDSLMDSIGGQPLMTETSFVSKDFVVGLSEKNENFTLSKQSLSDLNDLFNQRQATAGGGREASGDSAVHHPQH